MFTFFLFCAVIAGTVFLLQFVMLLVGMGAEGADFDTDIPDAGDVDFDASAAGDVDFDADAVDAHDHGVHDHGSTWLFGVISFRTLVAAVTFFGLAGMAMLSAGQNEWLAVPVAAVAGAGAMYVVHFLMRSLHKLSHDGKLRIRNAVGKTATVYVPIAAHNAAAGKIQVRMQGRLVELAAMSGASEELATGTRVRVVGVVSDSTVRVEPLHAKDKAKVEAAT